MRWIRAAIAERLHLVDTGIIEVEENNIRRQLLLIGMGVGIGRATDQASDSQQGPQSGVYYCSLSWAKSPRFDPEHLTQPGLGCADAWVYDSNSLQGSNINGGPLTILNLFTDSLRALAALPDGSRVYAAAFTSGNNTTAVDASVLVVPRAPRCRKRKRRKA